MTGTELLPDTAEPLVKVRSVTKSFDSRNSVLHGVDLEVAAGEWVAVMGPSGSGKSTLLHLIGGLDTPSAGTIELCGVRVDHLGESSRARVRRRTVGVLYQAYNLVPHLDALDNVALPIRLAGGSRRTARARARTLLERLGVGDVANATPSTLSGGQAQRVALARAVANDVPLLLADEPTGALDSESAGVVIGLLRRLHDEGVAIVMVTHDHRVASAADRVLFMLDGTIVDERVLVGPQGDPSRTTFSNLLPLDTW
jgi:putative ABC transport system ATP-binding protein